MCTHLDMYIYGECEAVCGQSMLHALVVWGYCMTSMKDYTGIAFQCYQWRVSCKGKRACTSTTEDIICITELLDIW